MVEIPPLFPTFLGTSTCIPYALNYLILSLFGATLPVCAP